MSTKALATGALRECLACGAHYLVDHDRAPAKLRCGSCLAILHVDGHDTRVTGSTALVLKRMPTPPSLEVSVERPTSRETSPYRQDAGEAPACVVVRWGARPSPWTWLLMGAFLAIGVLMMRHLFLSLLFVGLAVTTFRFIMSTKRWELRVQGGRAEHVTLPTGGWRSNVHHVMASLRPEHVHLLHHHVPRNEAEDGVEGNSYSVVVVNDEGRYDCGSFPDSDQARFLFRILLGSVPGSADELAPTFTPRDPDEP